MPTDTKQPELNNQQKICQYIKRSGALVAKAEKQAAAWAQKEAAVEALIPDVVEAMISNGRIPEDLRDKAAAQLKDPVRALEILASVAASRNTEELAHLGTPTKTASQKPRVGDDSPYVGLPTSDERPSDKLLFERFGIRV